MQSGTLNGEKNDEDRRIKNKMCLRIIQQQNIEIPNVIDNMCLVQKDFDYDFKTKQLTSYLIYEKRRGEPFSEVLNGNTQPVQFFGGYLYKFQKEETKYGIECKENNVTQRIEQLLRINGNTQLVQFFTEMGYHCFIPSPKVRYFSIHKMITTEIHCEHDIDILYHKVTLPILINLYDIQFCTENAVVVSKFTVPEPKILSDKLTKTDIKAYTKWYTKWYTE